MSDAAAPKPKRRASSLSPQDMFLLRCWGEVLTAAFGEVPYLVGSVARAKTVWRDVDVRLMLPTDEYEMLTGNNDPARLAVLNTAFSLWGRQATSLSIDFQFQTINSGNEHSGPRNPLCHRPVTP